MKRKLLILLLFISFGAFLVYFFAYTTKGADIIFRSIIDNYVSKDGIRIERANGNFAEGLTLKNIEFVDIKDLPQGSKLRIQKLFIALAPLNLQNLTIEVENARIMLPESDPILVFGTLKNKEIDVNIFSKGFGVGEVISYLPDLKALIPISGELNEIDLYLVGNYLEPRISGSFTIEKFVYKGFTLTKSLWNLDFVLKDLREKVKISGSVNIDGGELYSNKTKINIEEGVVSFSGQWNKPSFNIKANSRVEKTNIAISLTGDLDNPQLSLSSEPSFSKQKLMIMLATGKSWKNAENAMDTGVVSADLTKDFVDYFFFAGKTNKFAEKFGVRDVSVKMDKDAKGIGVKKDISEKLEVGYSVERKADGSQTETTTQKVQGEYKITNTISVGAEKEIKKSSAVGDINFNDDQIEENKVYLKYKKSF